MIDWSKPIETTKGEPAKVVSRDFILEGNKLNLIQVTDTLFGDSFTIIVDDEGINNNSYKHIRNKKIKKSGWINLYKESYEDSLYPGGRVYKTKEAAKEAAKKAVVSLKEDNYITTALVEWEE